MLAAPIVEMGETHDVGLRMGMYFTVIAVGALAGPPISGAINQATGGYKAVGYYAGTLIAFSPSYSTNTHAPIFIGSSVVLSVALLIISRHLILRRVWGKA
jgi:MFS transporter, MCT family, solute carrier family 16 (monocarboxylic acid transporters), member 10